MSTVVFCAHLDEENFIRDCVIESIERLEPTRTSTSSRIHISKAEVLKVNSKVTDVHVRANVGFDFAMLLSRTLDDGRSRGLSDGRHAARTGARAA